MGLRSRLEKIEAKFRVDPNALDEADRKAIEHDLAWFVAAVDDDDVLEDFQNLLGRLGRLSTAEHERLVAYFELMAKAAAVSEDLPPPPPSKPWSERQADIARQVRTTFDRLRHGH
jgi:hypothetical protein